MALWGWMRGTDGLAVAQWASAVVSVFAIGIALYVFLAEQRRDNAARLREQVRDREAREGLRRAQIDDRNEYVNVCMLVITDAIGILRRERDAMTPGEFNYVNWSDTAGVPPAIRANRKTAEAVRSARLDNPHLVLTMSRAIEVLNTLSTFQGAILAGAARQRLAIAISLLTEMNAEIESYFTELPTTV